jgi:hypothetical protein
MAGGGQALAARGGAARGDHQALVQPGPSRSQASGRMRSGASGLGRGEVRKWKKERKRHICGPHILMAFYSLFLQALICASEASAYKHVYGHM